MSLILSRRKGQAIHIGDNIVVRVESIGVERVRLSIEAPPETAILRDELLRVASEAK